MLFTDMDFGPLTTSLEPALLQNQNTTLPDEFLANVGIMFETHLYIYDYSKIITLSSSDFKEFKVIDTMLNLTFSNIMQGQEDPPFIKCYKTYRSDVEYFFHICLYVCVRTLIFCSLHFDLQFSPKEAV